MTYEERQKILEPIETDFTIKNRILKGLQILAKYTEELMIEPAHDELFAGCQNDEEHDRIIKEDVIELGKMGWMCSSEDEGFSIFT